MPQQVILVHGLWLAPAAMSLLGRRLRANGYQTRYFGYPSVRRSPAENAQALARLLLAGGASGYHLVCHSLGGLVVRHLLQQMPQAPVRRMVFLGTPQSGSQVAARLAATRWGRLLLGRSLNEGLLGGAPAWEGRHELGLIAGNLSVGAGRLIVRLSAPHDGTVAVAESHWEGCSDHIVLPVSHSGLLFSREVARQVVSFLGTGHFDHGD